MDESKSIEVGPRPSAWSRIGRVAVLAFAAVVVLDAARVLVALTSDEGLAGALADPLAWHKAGEAALFLAWATFLSRRPGKVLPRWLALTLSVVALIQVWAWFDLRARANWSAWCLYLAAFPVAAALAARWVPARRALTVLASAGWLVAAFAGLLGSGYRWYPIPAAAPPTVVERTERGRQDLEYLASELPRLHVDAFHTTSPEAFRAAVDRLAADLPQISDLEFGLGIARIVASIGDAHTSLSASFPRRAPHVPISVEWMADGLIVTAVSAAEPGAERWLGARVTHVGGVPAEDALAAVAEAIPHDNRSWLLRQSPPYLVRPSLLRVLGLPVDESALELTLETDTGTETVSLVAGSDTGPLRTLNDEARLADRHPERLFWYELLDDGVLYVRYRKCRELLAFRDFATDVLEVVRDRAPQRLVLDLRGNTGGSSLQFSWFLLPGIRGSALDDPGRLFLLVDRGTYSSGSGNAIEVAETTNATVIGEPTGGALNSYGEVRWFLLPNTGLAVTYSTKYHERRRGAEGDALVPDALVVPSSSDWKANRDPVLERALE